MIVNTHETFSCYVYKGVFDIGIPILGVLIWACPNLILNKTETTIKRNFSFFIKSPT